MRARLGTPEATTATAHKLARIIYYLITYRVAYDDSILAAEERIDLRRFERRLRRQARALGYELVPEAAQMFLRSYLTAPGPAQLWQQLVTFLRRDTLRDPSLGWSSLPQAVP